MSAASQIRELLAAAPNGRMPYPEVLARIKSPAKTVYSAVWAMQRTGKIMIDVPEDGPRVLRLAGTVEAPASATPPSRAPRKRAHSTPATALPAPLRQAPATREHALRQLGTDMIDGLQQAAALLRTAIDAEIDGTTPLLVAAMDNLDRQVRLVASGYRAVTA